MRSRNTKSRLGARFSVAVILAAASVSVSIGQNVPQLGAPPAPAVKPGKPTPPSLSGVFTLAGKGDKTTGQTYASTAADVSAIYVKAGGDLTVTDATVTSSADTTSQDNSVAFGQNAAVLAVRGKIKMTGGSVTTSGIGATGVFAGGAGTNIALSKVKISTAGSKAVGVATSGGTLVMADLDIATTGANAPAIATEKLGGNITLTGGTFATSGSQSPAMYATGSIRTTGATLAAAGAEAAVVDGKGIITLIDTKLTSNKGRGVMIYQSGTTTLAGVTGAFNMKGGSILATDGPLFYVTNTTATVFVTGVNLNASSGTLIKADADQWGTTGFNGGTMNFTADHETLAGDLIAAKPSTIVAKLQNETTLSGTVNSASISLDSSSIWTLTGDSTLATLTDSQGAPGGSFANIVGNGHDAHYDASLSGNSWLRGKTYNLASGGHLIPIAGTTRNNGNNNNNQNPNNNGYNNHGGGGGGFGGSGGGGHH